jgi:Z1 domain-containing protein
VVVTDLHHRARGLVLQLLQTEDSISTEDVVRAVDDVTLILSRRYPDEAIDAGALCREIEALCNVFVPRAETLTGDDEHQPWLEDTEFVWNFWARYQRYLIEEKGWAPPQVSSLNEITSNILSRFEDPKRPGPWDRRGMVVGQVQSGKTANYTGLICKAADAGYRLIIVLAGMHNSLRSQTQHRLDREFLGFDTRSRRSFDQSNARIGVGALKGEPILHAHSLTSSDEKGDFQKRVAGQVWVSAGGGDPVLLVVKKNASVLKNLYSWATDVMKETDHTGRQVVRNVPLLVIDDEADNASVNTKARPTDETGRPVADYDPTRINGWIRKLLHTFEQSVYVAYTATPFANIFIDQGEETKTYGEDLFPRSFIVNLRPPNNYTGVARVFGLDEDATAGIEAEDGLPVLRTISDYEMWLPDKHNKEEIPGPLPESLIEAVDAFLLATATRRARGQSDHNTMLVHVTRFTAVQAHVRRDLEKHLELQRSRILYADEDAAPDTWSRLRALWERDFVRTTAILLRDPDLTTEVGAQMTWDDIRKHLPEVVRELELVTLNGTSDDALTYTQSERPLTLVAVGGDKLSRGLTLEGLTVSYYLRAAKMYDTLMQMGRWFGYRPGYLDVCRMYTSSELSGWYKDIALANEELLREFEYMESLGRTPSDYGLRVRAHPAGLMITAAAKMRTGTNVEVTFSQTISETIRFDTSTSALTRNLDAARQLVSGLGHSQPRSGLKTVVWNDVSAERILDFLNTYRGTDAATKARPKVIGDYIRSRLQLELPELTRWTVALISVPLDGTNTEYDLAGIPVGLVTRSPDRPRVPGVTTEADEGLIAPRDSYLIRRLVNPDDELLDLSPLQRERALFESREAWVRNESKAKNEPTRAGGLQIRAQRDPGRGLLMVYPLQPRSWTPPGLPPIGFAVSFPRSNSDNKITYRVTNLWWDQEFGSGDNGNHP